MIWAIPFALVGLALGALVPMVGGLLRIRPPAAGATAAGVGGVVAVALLVIDAPADWALFLGASSAAGCLCGRALLGGVARSD